MKVGYDFAMMKIDESVLNKTDMIGCKANSVIKKICMLIDFIFSEKNCFENIDLDFFNIQGSVLLYGIPGIGKTTIVYNCLRYALDEYGVESYTFNTSDIIVTNLGQATKNLHDKLEEFQSKEEGILFLDEIDRLCVNRQNSNEISELKRMLIELMQFLDKMQYSSQKMVIGCTNIINQLDGALIRRFSIQEEINKPMVEEKIEFINLCLEKSGYRTSKITSDTEFLEQYQTMDAIKKDFRDAILDGSLDEFKNKFI